MYQQDSTIDRNVRDRPLFNPLLCTIGFTVYYAITHHLFHGYLLIGQP